MKTKKIAALAVAVCCIAGLMSGCQPTVSSPVQPVTACIGSEPETLDPALIRSIDCATYVVHTFEGLTKTDKNNKIAPGTADSWEVSDDGLTYTFHLRADASWSDGKPVTAEDFIYAWQRAVNPATASAYAYQLYYVKNAQEINSQILDAGGNPEKIKVDSEGKPVKDSDGNPIPDEKGKYLFANADGSAVWLDDLGAKAVDDHTLVVTLSSPCSYFTEITAFPTLYPVRKDIVEANPDTWANDPATLVCDGPYVVSEWSHGSKIAMTKDPYYYDKGSIVASNIDWLLMNDTAAIEAAYKNGEILLADDISPDEIATLSANGECTVYNTLGTYYYSFNTSAAPLDNENVREALSLAFDREYLCDGVIKAGEKPAGAFVPYGIQDTASGSDFRTVGGNYYDPSASAEAGNIKKAQELLAEAGYPNGEGLPVIELKYDSSSGSRTIAEYLQQEWKTNLGIAATLVSEDGATLQADWFSGNYQITGVSYWADFNDPISFLNLFTSFGGNNITGWKNEGYDSLIQSAMSVSDQSKRMTDLHDAEDILMGDYVVCPIYYTTDPDLVSAKLKGYVHSPLGYKYLMWAYIEK